MKKTKVVVKIRCVWGVEGVWIEKIKWCSVFIELMYSFLCSNLVTRGQTGKDFQSLRVAKRDFCSRESFLYFRRRRRNTMVYTVVMQFMQVYVCVDGFENRERRTNRFGTVFYCWFRESINGIIPLFLSDSPVLVPCILTLYSHPRFTFVYIVIIRLRWLCECVCTNDDDENPVSSFLSLSISLPFCLSLQFFIYFFIYVRIPIYFSFFILFFQKIMYRRNFGKLTTTGNIFSVEFSIAVPLSLHRDRGGFLFCFFIGMEKAFSQINPDNAFSFLW